MIDFDWDQDLMVDWNLDLLRSAGEQIDLMAIHGYAVLRTARVTWRRSRGRFRREPHQPGGATPCGCSASATGSASRSTSGIRSGWHFPGFDDRDRPDLSQWDRNDDNSSYTMADALLHAGFLNACLRHCASVAMTYLSPLVNARGPIYAHDRRDRAAPTYHVCELYPVAARRGGPRQPGRQRAGLRGRRPRPGPRSLPYGDAVVTVDREAGSLAVALLNLHPAEPLACQVWVPGPAAGARGRHLDADGARPRRLQRRRAPGRGARRHRGGRRRRRVLPPDAAASLGHHRPVAVCRDGGSRPGVNTVITRSVLTRFSNCAPGGRDRQEGGSHALSPG